MEDLQRLVRVERREDLRDRAEVAVDELAEAARVVERSGAGAAGDEELEAGRAERVLDVDDHERDAEPILGGPPRSCCVPPAPRVLEARRVVDAPDLADALGVPVRRQRERLGHGASVGTWLRRSSRRRSPRPAHRLREVVQRRGRPAAPRARGAARSHARRGDRHGLRRRLGLDPLGARPGVAVLHRRARRGARGRGGRAARRRPERARAPRRLARRARRGGAVRPALRRRRQGEVPRGARSDCSRPAGRSCSTI